MAKNKITLMLGVMATLGACAQPSLMEQATNHCVSSVKKSLEECRCQHEVLRDKYLGEVEYSKYVQFYLAGDAKGQDSIIEEYRIKHASSYKTPFKNYENQIEACILEIKHLGR